MAGFNDRITAEMALSFAGKGGTVRRGVHAFHAGGPGSTKPPVGASPTNLVLGNHIRTPYPPPDDSLGRDPRPTRFCGILCHRDQQQVGEVDSFLIFYPAR